VSVPTLSLACLKKILEYLLLHSIFSKNWSLIPFASFPRRLGLQKYTFFLLCNTLRTFFFIFFVIPLIISSIFFKKSYFLSLFEGVFVRFLSFLQLDFGKKNVVLIFISL